MRFGEYLEDHVTFYVSCVLFLILQGIVLYFLGNNSFMIGILVVLWYLIFSLYVLNDFLRRRRRWRVLEERVAALDQKYLLHEVFPKNGSNEDRFYQELLRIGNKSMLEHISQIKRERLEYQEYIEQWVHEIKTPIAAMKLWSENQEGERKREGLKQLERTEHYVEQALFFARSESVEKDFRIQKVDIFKCVRESLLQCKYICTSSHMKIDLQEGTHMVYCDEKWLIFICNQILENAVKYRNAEDPKITISVQESEQKLQLNIVDNGAGICAEDLPRIFEKGFTGENGRTFNMHSTGIGLFLCKKLCEALEIEMAVESIRGTCTRVCLIFGK